MGIWVICLALLSMVFLLMFGNDRGHWTAACTLGGFVGSQSINILGAQSIVTQFCPEMVSVYPPAAMSENLGLLHFLNT